MIEFTGDGLYIGIKVCPNFKRNFVVFGTNVFIEWEDQCHDEIQKYMTNYDVVQLEHMCFIFKNEHDIDIMMFDISKNNPFSFPLEVDNTYV